MRAQDLKPGMLLALSDGARRYTSEPKPARLLSNKLWQRLPERDGSGYRPASNGSRPRKALYWGDRAVGYPVLIRNWGDSGAAVDLTDPKFEITDWDGTVPEGTQVEIVYLPGRLVPYSAIQEYRDHRAEQDRRSTEARQEREAVEEATQAAWKTVEQATGLDLGCWSIRGTQILLQADQVKHLRDWVCSLQAVLAQAQQRHQDLLVKASQAQRSGLDAAAVKFGGQAREVAELVEALAAVIEPKQDEGETR